MSDQQTKGARLLIEPESPVPGRVRSALTAAGLTTTEEVHSAILEGNLEGRPFLGPTLVRQILKLYTRARPGSGWGGFRDRGPGHTVFPHKVEATISVEQRDKLAQLRAAAAGSGGRPVSSAEILRDLIDRA